MEDRCEQLLAGVLMYDCRRLVDNNWATCSPFSTTSETLLAAVRRRVMRGHTRQVLLWCRSTHLQTVQLQWLSWQRQQLPQLRRLHGRLCTTSVVDQCVTLFVLLELYFSALANTGQQFFNKIRIVPFNFKTLEIMRRLSIYFLRNFTPTGCD